VSRRALTALLAVALAATAFVLPGTSAQAVAADMPDTSAWVTNGDVHTVVQANGRTYLGGLFDQVGPNTGFGVPLDAASGALPAGFASKVNGPVYAAVSDGAGGWYIGGNFTRVAGVSRHNAAHIKADGTAGRWNPNTDYTVYALAVDGDRIYIGGEFSTVGGQRVAGLAATAKLNGDLDPGAALPSIKPGVDAAGRLAVKSLALSPDRSRLFVGGTFAAVCSSWTLAGCSNEIARRGLAALNLGGTPAWDAAWAPQPDGPVAALSFAAGGLFVGGSFTTIAGGSRVGFALLDPSGTGGLSPAWRVHTDGPVDSMLVADNGASLYIGGSFTKVGYPSTGTMAWFDVPRLAKLVLVVPGGIGDVYNNFRPSPDGPVLALAQSPDGSRLYAGGSFPSLDGAGPRFLAALDPSTGAVDPNFNARVAATVRAVAASGTTAYAGGDFTSVGGVIRRNVAALLPDGTLDPAFEHADTDGEVNALVVSGNSLYIGGTFKNRHIPDSGRRRRGVMKVDARTGELDVNFKANIDSTVMALALAGSHLYIGGNFSTVNAEARSRGASVNAATGAVEAWNPNTDAALQAMVVSPDQSKIYIGGDFSQVAGTSRTRLAAVDPISGAPTSWRPAPPATIEKMALSADGSMIYLALRGAYGVGNRAQAWATGSNTLRWEVTGDGDFQAVAVTSSLVYIGGHFNRLSLPGGSSYAFDRQHLTALDPATGYVQPWGPLIGGVHGVLDLHVTNDYVYVAGEFDNIGNEAIQGIARFRNLGDTPPVTPTTQPPAPTTTTTTTTTTPGGGGNPNNPPVIPADTKAGYWMVGSDGAVYGFGDAAHFGGAAPAAGSSTVDLEPTPSGAGYWIVTDKGVVTTHGDAGFFGAPAAATLARGETVTSLSATPTGRGYWIFTSRGRVMNFGDAAFYGDVSKVTLNGPVLDSIPTTTGRGYYMVASDGGIFAFGDAVFHGSMGGTKLNKPVQSLVPDGDGEGYWLVASDGGIFAFKAGFRGSLGGVKLNKPVTGMVRYADGYMMVGEDGGIFNFSTKPFLGSLGTNPPARPIVSVAALG
jgi:trimeric autotransporter adhesin